MGTKAKLWKRLWPMGTKAKLWKRLRPMDTKAKLSKRLRPIPKTEHFAVEDFPVIAGASRKRPGTPERVRHGST